MKKKTFLSLLCVLLFALYPIAAMYAHNVEQLRLSQALVPVLATLLIAAICYGGLYLFLKNHPKACISAAAFLVLFWHYDLISGFFISLPLINHTVFLPALLVVYALLVYRVHRIRAKHTLDNLTLIVLIPAVMLVALNVFMIVQGEVKKSTVRNITRDTDTVFAEGIESYPDIYLLLFDEYAALPSMEEIWGYDNSAFAEKMEEKGFFFARNSKTRFVFTHMAVPGILNLDYPDEDISRSESMVMYNHNYVFKQLHHELGYGIYFLDGWGSFQYTFNIPVEEFVCLYNTEYGPAYRLNEFSYLVLSRSMLMFLKDSLIDKNANLYYQAHNYFIDYIENFPLRASPGDQPRLLWAHVMAPHLPYVFDRDGNFNENPTNHWEYRDLKPEVLRSLYLEQYIHITQRIDELTTAILERSGREPVIVLLSDHGPRLESVGVADPKQHHRVLNAVYFPGRDYSELHDSIAPVNTMRVLFNQFFGTDYDMLDDI
jgi:hypothetical protein